ncbi:hypothetical protein BC830DRAFT_271606 [Chytriomyces sp. MP71]|nr:hypothetical protein BC830DRAFT_271606 [Chytriomyces sp. MP71]
MFGDQTYIDATVPAKLTDRLDELVMSIDRVIATSNAELTAAEPEESTLNLLLDIEPKVATEDVDAFVLPDPNPVGSPTMRGRREFVKSSLQIQVGETVEVLRWRKNNRNYFVAGGLHWQPARVIEIKDSESEGGVTGRKVMLLFQAKITFVKTKSGPLTPKVTGEKKEWVDDFLIRRRSEVPKEIPEYMPGDAVEYCQFLQKRTSKRVKYSGPVPASSSVSETASIIEDEADDEGDTYQFEPAHIVTKLENGKYLIKQGRGMGLVAETGNFSSTLKPVNAKLLRIGHDFKLIRCRQWLNSGELVTFPCGSIVKASDVPDNFSVGELKALGIAEDAANDIVNINLEIPTEPVEATLRTPRSGSPTPSTNSNTTSTVASKAARTKWEHTKNKNNYRGADWESMTLRERLISFSKDAWVEACGAAKKLEPFSKGIVYVSHTFSESLEEQPESRSRKTMSTRYLMEVLKARGVFTIDGVNEAGVKQGLEDDVIQERLMKTIVKGKPDGCH